MPFRSILTAIRGALQCLRYNLPHIEASLNFHKQCSKQNGEFFLWSLPYSFSQDIPLFLIFLPKKTRSKAFFGRGLRLDGEGNEWCTKLLGSKMQHSLRWEMSLSISANRKDAAAKNYFTIHLTKAHLSKRRRRESFSGFYSPPPHFLRKYTVKVYTRWLLLSRLFSLPAQHMPCTALPVPPPLSPHQFQKSQLPCLGPPNPTQPTTLPFHRR